MMLGKECDSKSNQKSFAISVNNNEETTLIYEALSRGFFQKIWVAKETLIVTDDRNLIKKTTYKCYIEDWNTLMDLLKEVNLKTLPAIEAPTSKRLFDGAAHASLSITERDSTIQSGSFDHGHPPKAIEKLVVKMLSMSENAQKQ